MTKITLVPVTIISFFVTNDQILTCDSINYVSFILDNNTCIDLLLDTGASLSAIRYDTFCKLNLRLNKNKITINGIGGSLISLGYIYLNLISNGIHFNHKFYVFKNLPCRSSGIIGQDFTIQ